MTRTLRAALVVAVPIASALYMAWSLYLVARVPTEADWAAAAAHVREGWREGDCVVFSPQWAQAGAPHLQGLDVITSEKVDWYVVGKHSRLWVVASMGGRDPEVPAGYVLERKFAGSKVDVFLFDVPHPRGKVLFDFLRRIDKARVTRVYPDHRQECRSFRDRRWHCSTGNSWEWVGRRLRDIAGAVREVIWAHPLDRGVPVEVLYEGVPRGRTLVVHYGLTQRAIESGEGSEVRFQVLVDGRHVLDRRLGTREEGWFELSVDLAGFEGDSVDVKFVVSAADPHVRQLCFTADVWG